MKKILGILVGISLAAAILFTSMGCSPAQISAAPDKDTAQNPVVTPNWDLVKALIESSSTFRFDGVAGNIRLIDFTGDAADVNWLYNVEYQTSHAGHGDRTGHMLAQVITNHKAIVKVTNGEITSAVCDGCWDIVKDAPVAVAQPDVQASLGQEFKLPVGQNVAITGEDLVIKFIDVTTDSRSPKGAQTIWAGEAVCRIQVTYQGATSEMTLTEKGGTAGFSQAAVLQYTVNFQLQPYPEVGNQPAAGDYALLLKVTK